MRILEYYSDTTQYVLIAFNADFMDLQEDVREVVGKVNWKYSDFINYLENYFIPTSVLLNIYRIARDK